jgi:putative ABC transport system permease protein
MDSILRNLRFTARSLLKRPAFTVIAVLTLALGIGANTAIFSVVDSVLLSPLPYPEAERLVVVWSSNPRLAERVGLPDELPVSAGAFYDWRENLRSFDGMALISGGRVDLTGEGEPEQLAAVRVSGDFFEMFGVGARLGRALQPADDRPGEVSAVVLSDAFWRRRFGADPAVVGRTLRLDGRPVEVVGVMPPSFRFPRSAELPDGFGFAEAPEVWLPLSLSAERRADRGSHNAVALARLAEGVSRARAQAEMEPLLDRLESQHPEDAGWRARLEPLREQVTGGVRKPLLVLLGAVGVVLLIACVNVASLLLAQAAAREREIAVRAALGAGRGRIVGQLLTESLALAAAGAVVGLLAGWWSLRAFAAFLPPDVPLGTVGGGIALDVRVLLFTLGVALLAGLLAGLTPALQMTRPDLASSLREGARGSGGTARGGRTRAALVIVETALAVLLVVGAGLLVRSFARLVAVDPGFRPENVLTLTLSLPETRYEAARRHTFAEEVLAELRALPGVTAAGMVSNLPMSGSENINGVRIEGSPPPEPGEFNVADFHATSPGYFEAMGIPLRAGRDFAATDRADSARVALIDEHMAETHWPGQDPIGKRFSFSIENPGESWITVVGVVGKVRRSALHVDPRPQVYVPNSQFPSEEAAFALRTAADPHGLAAAAREAVYRVDGDQPVGRIRTLEEILAASVAGRRFQMMLLAAFAGLALALAAVGIYGVTSYSVAQRTREMGLRMALGAPRATVLKLVLREAGKLAALGLAAGLALALASTRVLRSFLYGVGSTDPATFAAVAVVLASVALLAAWLPSLRATRVDPMEAMRGE